MSLQFIVPLAKKVFRGRYQLRLWCKWAITRGKTVLTRHRIIRGTCIEWPQLGRAWAVPYEVLTPGPSEVLIRTVKSCVSPGTERAVFLRRPNTTPSFPCYPGYSLAGEVIQVGRKVTRLSPGDVVAASAPHASVVIVHQNQAYRVPAGVSLEEASFVHLGVIALYGLLQGKVCPGERVVVLGQGVIGHLLVQLALVHGAGFIASIARTGARSTPALRQRAHEVIALQQVGQSVLDTLGADVTYEATGAPEAIHDAIRATRPGGRVVLVGSPRGVASRVDFNLLAERDIALIGAHISGLRIGTPKTDQTPFAQQVLHLMAQKQLDVRPLISEDGNPLESGRFYRRLCQRGNDLIGATFSWDLLEPHDRVHAVSFLALPELWPAQWAAMRRVPLPEALAVSDGDASSSVFGLQHGARP